MKKVQAQTQKTVRHFFTAKREDARIMALFQKLVQKHAKALEILKNA